nr:DUF885 domain-containing protein [uncultured Mucilaginibacter sp.]
MHLPQNLFKSAALFLLTFFTLSLQAQSPKNNKAFNELLERYYEEGLVFNPLSTTLSGDYRYSDQLPNTISVPFLKKLHDFNISYQQKLAQFNRSSVSSFDKISFDMLKFSLENALEKEKFHEEYMPFNEFRSMPNDIASMGSGLVVQPFKTVKDYYNWLKRMDDFTVWADTAVANFNKGIATGMILPRALVVKMIPQLEPHTTTDTAKSIFYGPIKMFPASFTNEDKTALRLAYQNAIVFKIAPAYKKLADYLKTTYLPKARATSGFNSIPNGAAIYRYRVKFYTTTNQTPDQVYQTGLSEVNRITKAITELKGKAGFKGSIAELFDYMTNDRKFFPFKTDEQVLDSFRRILPKMQPHLKQLFNIVPKAALEIRAVEKFRASTSSANYLYGAADGSRPGYFNVPIPDAANYNALRMEALFSHEGIPGHHFQLSLQIENPDFPKIRRFAIYSVFAEGWALYTESLGNQLGLYNDPYIKIEALKSELFRAVRLVVDVGMHTGKMTREEAIKYMIEKAGRGEQIATVEIERYMAEPGQALAYKTGEMKIKQLRDRYQKSLGTKFSIKKFHDAVLLGGNMPLSVFETYMNDWAATQ